MLRKLIYKPRKHETEHVAYRSRKYCKYQCRPYGTDKYPVRKKQVLKIGKPRKMRHIDHIKVRKSHRQRNKHRYHGKQHKKCKKRRQHEPAFYAFRSVVRPLFSVFFRLQAFASFTHGFNAYKFTYTLLVYNISLD